MIWPEKIVAVLFAATLVSAVGVRGQGELYFNNRILPLNNARFVLSTDPPGTSSVGTNFQVQLFGGPEGTPVKQLLPLEPPATVIRAPAGSAAAGYVVGFQAAVPGTFVGSVATVLVRAFDGPSWDTATYHFERDYTVALGNWNIPGTVWLGTDPLVLYPVPEPSSLVLALLGFAALIRRFRSGTGPACT